MPWILEISVFIFFSLSQGFGRSNVHGLVYQVQHSAATVGFATGQQNVSYMVSYFIASLIIVCILFSGILSSCHNDSSVLVRVECSHKIGLNTGALDHK